ncbi:dihydroorotate dehydrogenase [candidate division KSB1 bacterium]|nr:dihydroorotate dehydrogenase [candidate division KSB1 bacterium]
MDLSVNIGNLKLKNPILTASGTFGYGEEFSPYVDLNLLGGIVTKTLTLNPRVGNPFPRIVETSSGMLNSIGLANVGVGKFISDKLPFLARLDTKIIVNIAGFTVDEYVEVVTRLEDAEGIHAYEINVSCPNVKEGGLEFGSDPTITAEITEKIKKITDRIVIVKLTPNITKIEPIALAAEKAGADAISLINTYVGMAVDPYSRKPKLARIKGGLSGPAIKPLALAKLFDAAKVVTIPLIGIGGIMNACDVAEFMITGATAVEIGTANFVDPSVCQTIINDLTNYCIEMKIDRIQDIINQLEIE